METYVEGVFVIRLFGCRSLQASKCNVCSTCLISLHGSGAVVILISVVFAKPGSEK